MRATTLKKPSSTQHRMSLADLSRRLGESVTDGDWQEIVAALVSEAKRGSTSAAKLLVTARFGNKRWLSPADSASTSNDVSERKQQLLKILKPSPEESGHDTDGTQQRDGSARAS